MRRVVISGVGVVSPFGVGFDAFAAAIAAGRSAVGPIRSFDATPFATRVAGEAPTELAIDQLTRAAADDRAASWLDELQRDGDLRDRKTCHALRAAAEAWTSANATPEDRRAPLSIALGLEQAFLEDLAPITDASGRVHWEAHDTPALPKMRFRSNVDLAATTIRRLLGLSGPTIVNASACAAGTLAVAHAASLIERGATDIALAGGADSMVNPMGIGGFSRLGATSPRNTADACRPFDRRRDGIAIGEGAAMFFLELEDRARARGAKIFAVVLGAGSSQDAYRATAPRPDGTRAAAAMTAALTSAKLAPEAIEYINAHGTGTPLNDPSEARAIHLAFGAHANRVPVSSIKGAIGHLIAAAGAVELAACLLAFSCDLLPGTAHFEERDPDCDLEVIGPSPRRAQVGALMKSSFGFGGQNATLILGRPK